jgi:hypothetical protein
MPLPKRPELSVRKECDPPRAPGPKITAHPQHIDVVVA